VGTNDRYLPDKGLGLDDEKRAKRTNGNRPEGSGINVPGPERTTVGHGGVRGGEHGGKDAKSAVFPAFPGLTSLVITTLVTVSPFW
jgi:hypothetical protein